MVARLLPLHRFGWAFLLAWVFCVFYTTAINGYAGTTVQIQGIFLPFFFRAFPLFMSVIMLVIIVLSEKRLGSPASHPSLQFIAPLTMAVSTPLLFVISGSMTLTILSFAVGAILTGVGSGPLWVMWGEYYSTLNRDEVEFITPVSSLIAVLLILTVSSTNGWLALAMATSFPLISGLCLVIALKDARASGRHPSSDGILDTHPADELASSPSRSIKYMGRACFGILSACFIVCIEGALADANSIGALPFDATLLISASLICAVALGSTVSARRTSISSLFRWMCPLLVAGLVCIIWLGNDLSLYVAYTISIAARFAFCLITQMYFSNLASRGKVTPTQSFGLGWISVHLGDLLGVVGTLSINWAIGNGTLDLSSACALLILVLVFATMFAMNDRDTFWAEGVYESEQDPLYDNATSATGIDVERTAALPDSTTSSSSNYLGLDARVVRVAQTHMLTPRETEVLQLLARGRSIPYIRDELYISKGTASTHVKHIYSKLDVHSRQELLNLL
jgi:DNA-binding CsgD family transcriptional regulator